jgi:alpha-2-macroglobulin
MPSGEASSWTHQEKHPGRVLLFADLLPAGIHRQTIQLRATTSGRSTLPPARAEAMYAPEVHGRTTSGALTVE